MFVYFKKRVKGPVRKMTRKPKSATRNKSTAKQDKPNSTTTKIREEKRNSLLAGMNKGINKWIRINPIIFCIIKSYFLPSYKDSKDSK